MKKPDNDILHVPWKTRSWLGTGTKCGGV